jgi:hypothetical protein
MTQESKSLALQRSAEISNLRAAAREDAGFEKILKYRKGEYSIGDDPVAIGTQYFAHTKAWTKTWVKFVDGEVAERKTYRVALGERPPEREDLDDLDLMNTKDADGMSADPWVFQSMIPFEDMSSGEVVVFAASSYGGKRAIAELCDAYTRRTEKTGCGQPIIALASGLMPTKKFGKVLCPKFTIVGWDGDSAGDVEVIPPATSEDDFRDSIPY